MFANVHNLHSWLNSLNGWYFLAAMNKFPITSICSCWNKCQFAIVYNNFACFPSMFPCWHVICSFLSLTIWLLHAHLLIFIAWSITYMQFRAARSLWIKCSSERYLIPLAICRHISSKCFWIANICKKNTMHPLIAT